MDKDRTLLVGIDLGKEITQINCFDFTTYEPVPIGRKRDGERSYEIPTALAINPSRGEWYWADEDIPSEEQIIRIKYLLADVVRDKVITVGDYSVESYQVLKRFIVKVLSILKEYYPGERIRKLVVTLADKKEVLVEYLHRIGGEIGLPENALVVQNHRQSYMYYAISQPKELWVNNVGMFELDGDRLLYSQIDIDRKTVPFIIGVTQKDLSDGVEWERMAREGDEQISYAFLNAAGAALHKQYVTTVYVTGKDFEKRWANDALKELCTGRRVFRGQNLFTRGACYAARELAGEGKLEDCLFLDEEMIASNISLRLYRDAEIQDVLMVKAGTMWNEVDASVDVIPDDEDEIQITVQNVLKREVRAHMLSLSGFSGRENKMTRFTIRMRFADSKTCIVTLKDNGFGEFCPGSNRVWERYISID